MRHFKYLSHIDLKDYWLHGRLHKLIDSPNISKIFNLLSDQLNSIINYSNRIYISIYPCLGEELLKEHSIELALPDAIFRDSDSYFNFAYTYPIPFKNSTTNTKNISWDILRRDIIVKKYLMQDNSTLGFKRIGAIYGVCMDIEEYQTIIVTGKEDLGFSTEGEKLSRFKFPYALPLFFGDGTSNKWVDRIVNQNSNKDYVQSFVKIKFYDNAIDDLTYLKLKEIFNWMKPLTVEYKFERVVTVGTCNLNDLKICKNI